MSPLDSRQAHGGPDSATAPLHAPGALDPIGAQIGPYRVLERIGEGGFGIVYVAEQRSPVRRKVALKILKPGMDSREVLARFEAERQALAMMEHPNVAKVLDAGMTETGRPYFAMEHVAGVPITDYADAARLTTRQRLELFIPVCHAVQHAHQKGIIHRDLKPSNILVALFDGRPVPKVIDFGVAKALYAPLTDRTLHTEAGRLVGTPEYISPEQAQSGGLDIDTRTDIYSLGVILYELLTGTLPFDSGKLRSAGLDAMVRIIKEIEPPKPSTRLSTLLTEPRGLTGLTPDDLARRHGSDLRAIAGELRGDLDWIVLKAIDKDRTRRYATASDVAADVRRHLDHEPVSAGPPTLRYRAGKFVRKHRTPVAAALAGLLVLLASLIAVTAALRESVAARDAARAAEERADAERRAALEARDAARRNEAEANAQRERAEAAGREALAVNAFVTDIIGASNLNQSGATRDRTLGEVLDQMATRLGPCGGAPNAAQEPGVRLTLARALYSQGRLIDSRDQASCVVDLLTRRGLARTPQYAAAQLIRAGVLLWLDGADASRPAAEAALEAARASGSLFHEALALELLAQGAADPEHRNEGTDRAYEVAERSGDPHLRRMIGLRLAAARQPAGRYAESERLYREHIPAKNGAFDRDDPGYPWNMSGLGWALRGQGRLAEAFEQQSLALAWGLERLPARHPDITYWAIQAREVATGLSREAEIRRLDDLLERRLIDLLQTEGDIADAQATNLAKTWRGEWRLERSIAMTRRVLDRRIRRLGPDHGWTAGTQGDLAETLTLAGKCDEAAALLASARAAFLKIKDTPRETFDWLDRLEMDALLGAGRTGDARTIVERVHAERAARLPEGAVELRWSQNDLALVSLAERRFDEAERSVRDLIAWYEATPSSGEGVFEARSMLGEALAGLGRDAEAEPLLTTNAEAVLSAPVFQLRKRQAVDRCIRFYERRGDAAAAAAWRARPLDAPTPKP